MKSTFIAATSLRGRVALIAATCLIALFGLVLVGPLACGTHFEAPADGDDGPVISLGEGGFVDAPDLDGSKIKVDGGFVGPGTSVIREDRFITKIVSFTPGDCAGFGAASMPDVVLGPPVGGGSSVGSLDVVSLGTGGEMVVSFEPNEVIDGPGPDFLVFENAFWAGGNVNHPLAELAEISVSADGASWSTFACNPGSAPPYGTCAGWRPVYSTPRNGISPLDPATAGGDAFDLADVGVSSARFVRIRDLGTIACPSNPAERSKTGGFDLDAIAIVNAKNP